MKFFTRKEKRNAEGGSVGIEDSLLTALIGGGSEVTKKEALQIPTVSACITLIADRISSLPIKLYRQDGKEVTEIVEDRRLDLLNHDTGDTINASELKKLWIRDYFLGKGAYLTSSGIYTTSRPGFFTSTKPTSRSRRTPTRSVRPTRSG